MEVVRDSGIGSEIAIAGRRGACSVAGFLLVPYLQVKERAVLDDGGLASMSARERELNARLLAHAGMLVGAPKQLSVRLD
jgi:hypothetical protein